MSSLIANIVGVAAGLASMASFAPQIVKIVRQRDASSVSLKMFALTTTAFTLWTTFGFLTGSWPIAASNAVCLGMALTILGLRLRYGGEGGGQQDRPSVQRRPG